MRIISGTARGKKLNSFDGKNIRPTADRVREAIFSILTSRFGNLNGLRVLDLFTGTGALALEALSRGAASAVLIDSDLRSLAVVERNIIACHMEQSTKLICGPLPAALDRVGENTFDLIFADPPYAKGLIPPILTRIATLELLSPRGIVVTECGRGEPLPDDINALNLIDQRHYGTTTISLYKRTISST